MSQTDPCPDCGGKLQYLIALDQYRCSKCGGYHDVLDVENDHIDYKKPVRQSE